MHVESVSVPGVVIETDVSGLIRDGKPRLRRANPNDRTRLNVSSLIAALALLPDPIREDRGVVKLPLREKSYVIKSMTFDVNTNYAGVAICTPLTLKILHDSSELDLCGRLQRIRALMQDEDLPQEAAPLFQKYALLVRQGDASSELRKTSNEILALLGEWPAVQAKLDAPSDTVVADPPSAAEGVNIALDELGIDETKRKLRSHYRLERSRKIRAAKVAYFKETAGSIYCENCSFNFEAKYGARGGDFIEVHHKVPLAAVLPNTITYLSDLVLLCSNCHRIVHRRRPDLDIYELASITSPRWDF